MKRSTFFKSLFLLAFLFFAKDAMTQIITTVAGNGNAGYSGDSGLAIAAQLFGPYDIDFDKHGDIYIVDAGNSVIRKISIATGIITTVVGNGTAGYSGDNGLAINAQLNIPFSSAIDSSGNIYIADKNNYRVRKVDVNTGIITTIAGTGIQGFSGDGGLAINARLAEPLGVALDSSATFLYIVDGVNERIRRVNLHTGIISTIAGNGSAGYNGDNIAAVNASLNDPIQIAVDISGNIVFTDAGNYRVRKIDTLTGLISTIAGNGVQGYSGDGGLAKNAEISFGGFGISIDRNGNILFSDLSNDVVREIYHEDSTINTVAGNNNFGYNGDGIIATNAELYYPYGVAIDTKGNFYVADEANARIRKISIDSFALNEIYGYAYYDFNKNNLKDSNEDFFYEGSAIVKNNSDSIVSSVPNGNFRIGVDTGTFSIYYSPFKDYYTAVPQSHVSTFSGYNNIDTINFALQPIQGKSDLHISQFSYGISRPGFETSYQLNYQNVGTDTVINGTIQLIKDSKFIFDSSSAAYSAINGDTILWNYSNLKPLDKGSILVYLNLPQSVSIGDTVYSIATINPVAGDLVPYDDTARISQIVVGSYDPNDKSENHAGSISTTQVKNGEYLTYTIRFQNTGTYAAFNIVVRDTLDNNLDWNSLEMIDASNNYQLNITGGNKCAWYFNGISLPDSNTNEAASHGYIVYRIKAKNTLVAGNKINNTASIYFDYNLPVQTNTETTTVANDLVLPLHLLSFTAQHAGAANLLQWNTAEEINTDRFDVQRSSNGKDFTSIGNVHALNNGKISNAYTFTDAQPLRQINYYRLKMVDKDGKYIYSPVRNINNTTSFNVTLFPNPVKDILTLNFNAEKNQDLQIDIVNAEDKKVYTQKLQLTVGAYTQKINIASLHAGIYFIQCTTADGATGLKFVKQ